VAPIDEATVIERILRHLGLWPVDDDGAGSIMDRRTFEAYPVIFIPLPFSAPGPEGRAQTPVKPRRATHDPAAVSLFLNRLVLPSSFQMITNALDQDRQIILNDSPDDLVIEMIVSMS